jgi:hypothetical protein
MNGLDLVRFGQLVENGIIGFGALWAAWALLAAL